MLTASFRFRTQVTVIISSDKNNNTESASLSLSLFLYIYIYIHEVQTISFNTFFRMGTFIESTHMKLYALSKQSPPAAMHLLYRSNNFWKTPLKSSCVSVSMTFVTASFISSIVS